jgi:cytochrome P450
MRDLPTSAILSHLVPFALVGIVSLLVYRRFFHPLSQVPGPKVASITGLWRTRRQMLGSWHEDILILHKRYGRAVRIAPDEVSLVDADALKALYGAGGAYAPKTDWYDTWQFQPDQSPGVFQTTDRHVHSFLRKRVAAPYSMTGVLKYEALVQKCLDELWAQLATRAAGGGEYIADMAKWTNALAFDVVGELAFGEWLGHLAAGAADVDDLRGNILKGFIVASSLGHVPGQSSLVTNRYVTGLGRLLGATPPMDKFNDWSLKRIRARLEEIADGSGVSRDDMLAHFCRMKTTDGKPVSIDEIMAETGNIM